MRYDVEILINDDEVWNAHFYFDDLSEAKSIIAFIIGQGYKVRISGIEINED